MRKVVAVLALVALAPFALAACGGDDDNDVPAPEPEVEEPAPEPDAEATLQVSADPGGALAFEQDSLATEAGQVTVEFDNPAPVPHDVVIEDADGNEIGGTDVITDSSDSVTLDLEPGEYTFFCSVPGHREGGMEGPLAVE